MGTNPPEADFEPPKAGPKGKGQDARSNGWGGGSAPDPALTQNATNNAAALPRRSRLGHTSCVLHYRMPTLAHYSERYRALSFDARMDLALSADLDPNWRPLLVRDQHAQVKAYFSRRVDLSPEEIALLLGDPNQTVRLNCAKRADLTPEQVEACVCDPDPNLRYFVARNPLLTEEQRQRLLADSDELVRIAARKGPKERTTRSRPGQAEMLR